MIGVLDQKIRLERRAEVAKQGGGKAYEWAPLPSDFEPWASVEIAGGDEREIGGGTSARIRAVFKMRARSDLTERDRIIWDGRAWNITGLGKRVARARYQRVEAVAGEIMP
jgi:SPP1 family predicted phage head-tail adaptor